MDISKNFSISMRQLWNNKIILAPLIAPAVAAFIAVIVMLSALGLWGFALDTMKLYSQYQSEHPAFIKTNQYNQDFFDYAQGSGLSFPYHLFSTRNIIIIIAVVLLLIIFSYLCKLVSYAMIASAVKKNKIDINASIRLGLRNFFRIIWAAILSILIIGIPLASGLILIMLSSMMGGIVSAVSIIAVIICMLIGIVYAILRIFFVTAIIFLENEPAYSSVKKSIVITRGKWKSVLKIFGVIVGVSLILSVSGTSFDITGGLLGPATMIFSFLYTVIFLVLQAATAAFIDLFLFNSYLDIRSRRFK